MPRNTQIVPNRRRRLTIAAVAIVAAMAAVPIVSAAQAATAGPNLWADSRPAAVKAATTDRGAVELGSSFTPQVDGDVLGVRFYKATSTTGTHTGSLWSSDGTRLATATFTNETASGWQSVRFSAPVDVVKGRSYVVSYFAPTGGYAYTEYFSGSSVSTLLRVPSANVGRFVYGAKGGFPSSTYRSMNYWADVIFEASTAAPTASPTATATPKPTTTPTATPSPTPTATPTP